MSNYAIMPLNDYINACNKAREKVANLNINDKVFYSTGYDLNEILAKGKIELDMLYYVAFLDTSMSGVTEHYVFSGDNIFVKGKETIGGEVFLPHPDGTGRTYTIYIYQENENIMLYVPETYNGEIRITVRRFIDNIVSGDLADKIDDVYSAGKEAGGGGIDYDLFWDTFQQNGERINYQNAFSVVWNDEIYNPKYPINCTGAGAYLATSLFASSTITNTKVPVIISGTRADAVFQECVDLKRIPSLTLKNIVRFSTTFRNCKALEEMNVYGNIDVGGLDVSASTKLNKASWGSIINALSGDTSGLSMTGSLASVKKAFETVEGANDGDTSTEWLNLKATKSNWGVSLK